MRSILHLLLASALLALVSVACATVQSSVMVPERIEVVRTLGGSVTVEAEGSQRQALFGKRLIEPDALQSAVRESILRTKLFDEVVDAGEADHVLIVSFDRMDEPEVGLDARCVLAMRWRLQSGDRSRTLWEEVVTTTQKVNSYEEPSSEARGQAVIAKAIRANIRSGLERLSESWTPR